MHRLPVLLMHRYIESSVLCLHCCDENARYVEEEFDRGRSSGRGYRVERPRRKKSHGASLNNHRAVRSIYAIWHQKCRA